MNSGLVSLILPTRARPLLVERFFDSLLRTTSRLDLVEIVLYVDEDDIGSHHLDSPDFHVTRIIGPALSMGGYNSACYERARGEVIILVNDDIVIRTQGWDDRFREINTKFKDGIYLAYPNDLFKKSKFCTFPVMSRRTCELLIEPYPVVYQKFFIDPHLFDVFKRLQHAGFNRICYCEDVVFEHLHYRTGKSSYDETYEYGRKARFADDLTYVDLIGMRSAAANRLVSAISKQWFEFSGHEADKNERPSSVFGAVRIFSRKFLLDNELPYRWRFFLWYYFVGRYLAANGFLLPFVR